MRGQDKRYQVRRKSRSGQIGSVRAVSTYQIMLQTVINTNRKIQCRYPSDVGEMLDNSDFIKLEENRRFELLCFF